AFVTLTKATRREARATGGKPASHRLVATFLQTAGLLLYEQRLQSVASSGQNVALTDDSIVILRTPRFN
ncbi:MAG: hypothetical protein ACK5NN_08655, partial [Sphingomonadaceae bacterium]